jgi:hypothetical protein
MRSSFPPTEVGGYISNCPCGTILATGKTHYRTTANTRFFTVLAVVRILILLGTLSSTVDGVQGKGLDANGSVLGADEKGCCMRISAW